jgi:hypothetical protein
VFLIDGGAITWSSKKQELIVLSTTEAEYIMASQVTHEACWLWNFIMEVFQPLTELTSAQLPSLRRAVFTLGPSTLISDIISSVSLSMMDISFYTTAPLMTWRLMF